MEPTAREAALEMSPDEFRRNGYKLVDRIAEWLATLRDGPVTRETTPRELRALLGGVAPPEDGEPADRLLEQSADLLTRYSLFNGHPAFYGFITSSAAPIGALADLLASAVNPNVGGWILSPVATEIERQTVRWIAQLIGYPGDAGGVLVSGGNMANFVGFWVGRRVRTPWDLRHKGYDEAQRPVRVYTSRETHTWIQKAADLSGMGTDAIRWIDTDANQRMDLRALRRQLDADRKAGDLPLIVVGTAGSVSTGAIDALGEIGAICREYDLWFHVDGAYGAAVAVLPEAPEELRALADADSVAIDPHKWFYSPLEAGCALVRDAHALHDTFTFHPPYYPEPEPLTDDSPLFYHEFGPQNSRGFRALKVWLGIRQAGRNGLVRMIRDDIALARRLFERAREHPRLEPVTHGLSITTFRYVPDRFNGSRTADDEAYLDALNRAILDAVQKRGRAFLSNAVIDGRYLLRACIVNFRTTEADIDELADIIVSTGDEVDAALAAGVGAGAAQG